MSSGLAQRRWQAFGMAALVAAAGLVGTACITNGIAQEGQTTAADRQAQEHAKALSRAFRHAAEKAIPTVVTIHTRTTPARGEGRGENPFRGTPFEEFFNENDEDLEKFFRELPEGGAIPETGVGSGVIIDRSGLVLTNNHVVAGADEVIVTLSDGREYKGTDIRVDPATDLAVVRLEGAEDLPVATLGDSDQMEIGDWVIAVGNPFNLDLTVSAGIISGKGRDLGQRSRYLQTDAAINPGNSGGPLVNLDGEVIGINTAIATSNGTYQGVGFAIPTNLAKWVTQQLIESGAVTRAYLGVQIGPIDRNLAEQFGVPPGGGVLVSEVLPDTPAAQAGLADGDVITHFAGKKVGSPRDLQELVERAPLGSKQELTVLREGQEMAVLVTVQALPQDFGVAGRDLPQPGAPNRTAPEFRADELGLEVAEPTAQELEELGYKGYSGVLIRRVEPGSVADKAGLSAGMLILNVGRVPVKTVEEFRQEVEKHSVADGVLLKLRTDSGNQFVALKQE